MRSSASFEITVVAIVRILQVIEKRVRSTSFSITYLFGTSTLLLLVIRTSTCTSSNYHGQK